MTVTYSAMQIHAWCTSHHAGLQLIKALYLLYSLFLADGKPYLRQRQLLFLNPVKEYTDALLYHSGDLNCFICRDDLNSYSTINKTIFL